MFFFFFYHVIRDIYKKFVTKDALLEFLSNYFELKGRGSWLIRVYLAAPKRSNFVSIRSWKYKTREYRIHERPWLYLDDSPKVPSQLLSSAAYAENSWSPPNPDSYPLSFLFSFFFSLYSRRNTRANFNISILPSTCTIALSFYWAHYTPYRSQVQFANRRISMLEIPCFRVFL